MIPSICNIDQLGLEPKNKIELCGRIAYKSEHKMTPDTNEKFLKHIIGNGHLSVLEHEGYVYKVPHSLVNSMMEIVYNRYITCHHAPLINISEDKDCVHVSMNLRTLYEWYLTLEPEAFPFGEVICTTSKYKPANMLALKHKTITYKITNVSRIFTHQLVRHRMCAYTQKSQEYCKENNFNIVQPPQLQNSIKCNAAFIHHTNQARTLYNMFKDAQISNHHARFILPNACTTEIICTANIPQWILMYKLRHKAYFEMENVFETILIDMKRYKEMELQNDV